ncbi:MAG: 7TM diverse intracellular signaling domain-containing protein [Bacteroidota bacterium]
MAVFILNGSFEFMYYACFAFFMGLLFFLNAYYYKTPTHFNYYFTSYLDFVILCLGFFFYAIFLRKFLETKKNFPLLHKLFVIEQFIILISIALFSYFNFFSDRITIQNTIENITKYQWFITTVICIVYAVVHNNKMLNYLAVGHFFLLAASLLSQLLIQSPNKLNIPVSIWRDALFCFQLGITIELVFFLMALAFKNRKDIVDRTRERERLRLDNERKEFEKQLAVVEAKQEERNRISTDMHDELGSGVTAIRLMSEIVKTKMKGNTLPEIDKISSNANDLLSKMNTIIWTMSSSNDRLDNMIAYTRSYAFEFMENTNINCHFESDEFIPPTEMSGEKRRNIFLCVKESLNNIAKHSKANDVWLKVTILPGTLQIEIHDNGIGINLHKLREFGNGLNNMKKRIESIDGSFLIVNKEGTTTTFTVPL